LLLAQEKIRFEQLVLPHVDAAINLARWLLRNPDDAEDVAQEAVLRATVSLADSVEAMRALGCYRLCATAATPGSRSARQWSW